MDKSQYGRRDRLMQEQRHDTYRLEKKWPEPTVCTECRAVYMGGRWTWNEPPVQFNKVVCPACQRISQNYPVGHLELKGDFFQRQRGEILNLIKNEEKLEKATHPMERIIDIADKGSHTEITTTGVSVARRIGEAVSQAYKGEYSLNYGDGEKTVRILWQR